MPAFGAKAVNKAIVSGGLPAQDSAHFPLTPSTPVIRDSVSGNEYGVSGTGTVLDLGGGDLTYSNPDSTDDTEAYADLSSAGPDALPIKTWTGAFTILTRAWGLCNFGSTERGVLMGDLGASGNRGTCWGPNRAGDGCIILATGPTTLVSTDNIPGVFYASQNFRDYACIFEPSTSMRILRDSVVVLEKTDGIPASRYVGGSKMVVLGNRGDTNAIGAGGYFYGEIKFVFFYKRVLSVPEIEAVFANPIYVPGGG